MMYLISPKKKQYKANLHCHSVLSDGAKTPEELKQMYKNEGYSILAITDHERPMNHSSLSDEDFIMLTGYEGYIRENPDAKHNKFQKEIHLNLFAKEQNNESIICFNENYCKYAKRDNAIAELHRVGSERQRELTVEYVNEYIRTARDNGYLVAYNHPYWSMQDEATILSYEGLFSLEMCNYGSLLINGLEYSGALYDRMLTRGKRIFCHSADDNHNGDAISDSFGAFTMIMPEEFTYSGIIEAMENGAMYSSTGPIFKEVSLDGDSLHIECSEVKSIFVYDGSKNPRRVHSIDGKPLTSADFKIDENARYIRVSVCDFEGKRADTRGFFPDEIGLR